MTRMVQLWVTLFHHCLQHELAMPIFSLQVCFVGMTRSYSYDLEPEIEANRQALLLRRGASSCDSFTARSAEEKPRNAVCIDHSIKDLITTRVLRELLSISNNRIEVDDERTWNKGGKYQWAVGNTECQHLDPAVGAVLQ